MPRVYTKPGTKPRPYAERLAERTNKNGPIVRPDLGPCHVWTGAVSNGYGSIGIGSRSDGSRRQVGTHVLAFFVANGRWPDPSALHHCDNRLCVKAVADKFGPAHIFEGTHTDNMRDASSKGRHGSQKHPELRRGENNGMAKLTEAGVKIILASPNESRVVLSRRLGVSKFTVTDVRSGRRWSHVKS